MIQNLWFRFPSRKLKPKRRSRQSGQIIVEYVLLLVVAVSIAALMTRMMISRNTDNPGFVISAWTAIINAIAQDKPDDLKRD